MNYRPCIISALCANADRVPNRLALAFLKDGETVTSSVTFRDFVRLVGCAAAEVRTRVGAGERVILAYPQGIDFLTAFIACLWAKAVPVPVPVPRSQAGATSLRAIVKDCLPRAVLTSAAVLGKLRAAIDQDAALGGLAWHETDRWHDSGMRDSWREGTDTVGPIKSGDVAYLQYTSGSTSAPRGVMISHANLAANQAQIAAAYGHDAETVIGSWLPMFHDMGLAAVLQALWLGVPCYVMPPAAFIARPLRWPALVSQHRITSSGGPNFAFELCASAAAAGLAELDLACWHIAFCGAEPISAGTIERFCGAYATAGFSRCAFFPVYGLAEATAFVTGGAASRDPVIATVDTTELKAGRIVHCKEPAGRHLVGCGRAWPGTELQIVDPDRSQALGDDTIGEIWVRGASVSAGYWRNSAASAEAFDHYLEGTEAGFLRTGDLGFLSGGNLFVVGRSKDLIIVRGENHAPYDIEATVAASHPAFEPRGGAAFQIEHDGEAQVVVVLEVRRRAIRNLSVDQALVAAKSALAREHGIELFDLVLLKPGALPRTSSGKPQRLRIRDLYEAGMLTRLPVRAAYLNTSEVGPSADELNAWLRDFCPRLFDARTADERRTLPPHIVLEFGNRGLLGMLADPVWGGLGFTHREMTAVLQQLAAIDLTACLFVGLNNYLGIRPISRFGSDAVKARYLNALATGRALAAFALTEPGAGSNIRAIAASAELISGGRWRLHGRKIWSGAAAWASVVIVFANLRDADGSRAGMTAFAVDRDAAGLVQAEEAMTMGMRGLVQNTVLLDGVEVDGSHILGRKREGMLVANDCLMHARLAVAAACVGAMKRCAQLGHAYAQRRHIATGPLIENPVTIERLQDLVDAVAALESLVDVTAVAIDHGAAAPEELLAACKAIGPELLWKAVDDLAQLTGGRGYMETTVIPRLIRDARVLRIFEGPTETMHAFLGARLLADGGKLAGWIESELGQSEMAHELRSLLQDLRGIAGRSSSDGRGGLGPLGQQRLGEAGAWLLLAACAASRGVAERWSRAGLVGATERLRRVGPDFAATPDAIAAAVGGYAATVGVLPETDLVGLLDLPSDALRGTAEHGPTRVRGKEADRDAATIESWIVGWVGRKTGLGPHAIQAKRSFFDQGLDSIAALELVYELSAWLGRPLEDTLPWDFSTVEALSRYLAGSDPTPDEPVPNGGPAIQEALQAEIDRIERSMRSGA